MAIDARHTLRTATGIVQRKVLGAVFPRLQIGVLTHVVAAAWGAQECVEIAADGSDGRAILVTMLCRPRQCVDTQILGLEGGELFEMRVLPVAVGRVLIHTTPYRVEQGACC